MLVASSNHRMRLLNFGFLGNSKVGIFFSQRLSSFLGFGWGEMVVGRIG